MDLLGDLIGLAPEQSRQLLIAGFAGTGQRAGRATMYDERQVRALASRPFVDLDRLAGVCPHGLYIARLSRSTGFDLAWPWRRQADVVASQPWMPPLTRATINVRIAAWGCLPWVATISGFVAFGADATGVQRATDGTTCFRFREPGGWFDFLTGTCFPTGRGRHWVLWLPRPLQE
jgi:hypothetical protein